MNDAHDMPTVDDLRAIARAAFEELRGVRPATGRGAFCDLAFALRELHVLGQGAVYDAEYRRHELLKRGFTPPESIHPRRQRFKTTRRDDRRGVSPGTSITQNPVEQAMTNEQIAALVLRLRMNSTDDYYTRNGVEVVTARAADEREAADAIEALQSENARLRVGVDVEKKYLVADLSAADVNRLTDANGTLTVPSDRRR